MQSGLITPEQLPHKYKYEIHARDGTLLPVRADPYARRSELRPATASVVAPMPAMVQTAPTVVR